MDLTTIRNGNKINLYNEIYLHIQQLTLLLNPQFINSDLSLIAKQKDEVRHYKTTSKTC